MALLKWLIILLALSPLSFLHAQIVLEDQPDTNLQKSSTFFLVDSGRIFPDSMPGRLLFPTLGTTISGDSVSTDSLLGTKLKKTHSASTAALMSAVLPGLGQVYNKKYWKVPIFYGAAAGLIYLLDYNMVRYKSARQGLLNYYDGDSTTEASCVIYYGKKDSVIYTGLEDLRSLKTYYRNFVDLSAIGLAVVYALNIVDAVVDAHLYDFDVSDDLSMRIKPDLNAVYSSSSGIQFQPGFSLRLSLQNNKQSFLNSKW